MHFWYHFLNLLLQCKPAFCIARGTNYGTFVVTMQTQVDSKLDFKSIKMSQVRLIQ